MWISFGTTQKYELSFRDQELLVSIPLACVRSQRTTKHDQTPLKIAIHSMVAVLPCRHSLMSVHFENVPLNEDFAYAKVTRRLIPFLFCCYIVAYLDRVNNAASKPPERTGCSRT